MALLTHITDFKNAKHIERAGIKPGRSNVVFFMPLTQDFLISHQWARELKRLGVKNFAAVDFRLPNDEMIWFGKYNKQHENLPLNQAISTFMNADDLFGYEFFIERKIGSGEIQRTRRIAKPVGWRYEPGAHGKKPCPCPMCLQFGGYKTNKLKEVDGWTLSKTDAKQIIATSDNDDDLWEAVRRLQGKWKKESPQFLERLLGFDDEYLLGELVELLAEYRHPLAAEYLRTLAASPIDDVREAALECLSEARGH